MAKTTSVKKVQLLCAPEVPFSFGEESIPAGQLTVEQAEAVAAQYPDQYLRIIEEKVNAVDTNAPTT